MSEGYLDLDPEAVGNAGNNTAATSGAWSGWAGRAEGLLRDAVGGARESSVSSAFEGYLSTWNPSMQALARQVHALGSNATAASGVMAGADGDSASLLGEQTAAAEATGSHLSRPITG